MEKSSSQHRITLGITFRHSILHWSSLGRLSTNEAQPHEPLVSSVASDLDQAISFSFDAQHVSSVPLFQLDAQLAVERMSRSVKAPEATVELDTTIVAHELGSHC